MERLRIDQTVARARSCFAAIGLMTAALLLAGPVQAQIARPAGPLLQTAASPEQAEAGSGEAAQGSSPATEADAVRDPVDRILAQHPWDVEVFADGGLGTVNRTDYKFFDLGVHLGKAPFRSGGPHWMHGQFEYGIEVMPLWQAYTPRFESLNCYEGTTSDRCTGPYPTGGTYTGISITPIVLRWNLAWGRRWLPWVQGAGGLIWTNHKFPPVGPHPAPGHLGTSVFNFTPQFGIGVHYFVRPRQSISFAANAVHISNASLGDANPGVNASVQFTAGYTWWR